MEVVFRFCPNSGVISDPVEKARKNGGDALKGRRAQFIRFYLENQDPVAAAEKAGYAAKNAARFAAKLMADPEVKAHLAAPEDPKAGGEASPECSEAVSVEWVVREARRTYDAAHEAGSLSTAVSCLNLIGKHLETRMPGEEGMEGGLSVVTGIEGAPNSNGEP